MLLSEIKRIFQKELKALYPLEEINSFFYAMVEHYLDLPRFVLVVQPNYSLTAAEEQPLFEGLHRLKSEEPLQYILGETEFMGLRIQVNQNVLIPRPETEELVRWVISHDLSDAKANPSIIDIGTGSGCIAIALANSLPKAKVFAVDISEKALEIAYGNAIANQVNVDFGVLDILNFEAGVVTDAPFDLIISNPPYVRDSEKATMQNNVKAFEPEIALFVSDSQPLLYYEAIVDFAKQHLNQGGMLFLEINEYLGRAMTALLDTPEFGQVELKKDIFGKDRMIKAVKL